MDLLKYLCAMIVAVLCYLAAFTASAMDFLKLGGLIGLQEEKTNTCRPLKWDYVTQAGEILILTFGLHLGIASRNAATQFRVCSFLIIYPNHLTNFCSIFRRGNFLLHPF